MVTAAVLLPVSPQLLADRSGMPPGAKRWDIPLALLVGYSPLFLALAAGLEHAGGGPLGLPGWAAVPGHPGDRAGDRGEAVGHGRQPALCARGQHRARAGAHGRRWGPYRWVRHPGYSGMLLFTVAAPVLLDSAWTAVVAVAVIVVTALRTAWRTGRCSRSCRGTASTPRGCGGGWRRGVVGVRPAVGSPHPSSRGWPTRPGPETRHRRVSAGADARRRPLRKSPCRDGPEARLRTRRNRPAKLRDSPGGRTPSPRLAGEGRAGRGVR